MNILYVSQYYHPEVGAPTNRAQANVQYLVQQGHEVSVLCEMPNHPTGIVQPGYKGKWMAIEGANPRILRAWVAASPKKTFLRRLAMYFSFPITGLILALCTRKQYDVVYVSSPPLFTCLIGLGWKLLFPSTRFVFELRDLWPEAAIEMGQLKNPLLQKFSRLLANKTYKQADAIVTILPGFCKRLQENYSVNPEKLKVIYNGVDDAFFDASAVKLPKSVSPLKVVYAGNLGLAQNISIILKAACKFREEDIEFHIYGEGPESNKLKAQAQEWNLSSVFFHGEVSRDEMMHHLQNSSVGVVPLIRTDTFRDALPTKMFDYMACGLPILLGVEGIAEEVLNVSKAGIAFVPDDSDSLSFAIRTVMNDPERLNPMAMSGREYVQMNFLRSKQAEKLEMLFQELFGRRR